MSQPPGQYGGQYGQPGPYGQPGQAGSPGQYGPPAPPPPYGQPGQGGQYGQPAQPGQYGQQSQPGSYGQPTQPAYGQPGQYGQPGAPYGPGGPGGYGPGGPGGYGQPPKKNGPLPWIITAVVVVLVGAGVLTFFLVRGSGNNPTPVAASTPATSSSSASSSAATSSSAASSRSMPSMGGNDTGSIPGGATSGTMNGGSGQDNGQFNGSDQVALSWMQAMAKQDFQTVYNLTCSQLQQQAQQVAAQSGTTAPNILGAAFYKSELNGQGITNGSLDSVQYDSSNNVDDAAFTLQLADGSTASVTLAVGQDLTVCDWSS